MTTEEMITLPPKYTTTLAIYDYSSSNFVTRSIKNNKFIQILLLHRFRVFQYRRGREENPKIEFLSDELEVDGTK
jgi:hypothetical protein